jgi:hypothetical protein
MKNCLLFVKIPVREIQYYEAARNFGGALVNHTTKPDKSISQIFSPSVKKVTAASPRNIIHNSQSFPMVFL